MCSFGGSCNIFAFCREIYARQQTFVYLGVSRHLKRQYSQQRPKLKRRHSIMLFKYFVEMTGIIEPEFK